ncbi:MAG: type II toxin-antitoxin system VapC family toxin [Actinomycetota bacterium]|nr:type II toxin-antitoxin system VapC family toxin [Actinomycetota bacterium]
MTLLLDTHALLWWLTGAAMAETAMARITEGDELVLVSAASIWEASIKRGLGKLRFDGDLGAEATTEGFEPLPVTFDHAEHVRSLPPHHRDPFDRILIAQAQLESLTIVTRDARLEQYDVQLLGC